MQVVHGVDQLTSEHGPVFVVVGVFDGLHLGHEYLLEQLVREAAAREARPTVITFDHHPDEVLTGKAPPLLLDPAERLERLSAAGVAVTVVQHFDQALRETAYQTFVGRIQGRVRLRGFLMTPDAAFGFQREGTPALLAVLGSQDGFEVVVVPPFSLEGRPVRSSEIRAEIAAGDLAGAEALLGRPATLTGVVERSPSDESRLAFELPVALPPDGEYAGLVGDEPVPLRIAGGMAYLGRGLRIGGRVTVKIRGRAATTAR